MPLLTFLVASALRVQNFDANGNWSAVAGAIRSRYYGRTTMKAKMDSLLAEYEPKAKGAKTLSAFEATVNDMIRGFGDSHFALLTRSDQGYYLMDGLTRSFSGGDGMEMPSFGAWIRQGVDGYSVQMVIDGMPAQKADLRQGDKILTVNGQPFSPIDSIASLAGSKATLEIRRGSQNLRKTVDVIRTPPLEMFLEGCSNSTRVIDSGGKKFGYFHLWTQASKKFIDQLSFAVYGPLKDTDAFILDLRDGFGGRPEGYADPFFRPDITLDWTTGGTTTTHELFGYQRPLVVLINRGSRSAKEVLSYILKKSKRAILIGSNTAGDVLGTSPMKLGDWGYMEIPMVDLRVDGERLERVGVAPDIAVATDYDTSGTDLVLAEAVRYLNVHTPLRAKY